MRYAMAHTQNEWRIYIDVMRHSKKRKKTDLRLKNL